MSATGIGASVRRKEDFRFITGQGTYVDDINRPGQTHAYFLRSPHAHAKIRKVDTAKASAMPGVIAILTGADVAAAKLGGLPCGWLIHSKDGSPMKEPPHPILVADKVRHVGDNVAVVVAETYAQAKDAAQAIDVDYQALPAAASIDAAAKSGAALVHDDVPGNVCYDWHLGDKAATDAAFAKAAHVTKIDVVNNRLVPNAIEPRAAIAEYDRAGDAYTVYTTTQNPHVIRLLMGAFVLQLPEHKLRIVAPDVGGGFGSKIFLYAEETVLTWASKKVGRPIKWTAERSESFMTDAHGRDHVTHAELALDKSGKFLGLRVSTKANVGAYLSTFGSSVPTYLYATLLAGQYTTPTIYAEVKSFFTNTTPVDAYRGAGRPEATYILESIVNKAAAEMKIDQAEIRRRNFIQPNQFPYQTPVALQYDTGNYEATMGEALKVADYAGFEKRRAEAKARGKLRGIGVCAYIEACGIAPSNIAGALGARAGLYEAAEVRFHPTGSVSVFTGSHAHGQGHETTFAQVVADKLGVPFESIDIVHGDTNKVLFGMGTYGSRSLAVGGTALVKACDKIIAKGKKIAAHLLEAAEADIEFKAGKFSVAGTDKGVSMGEVAFAAYVPHKYPLDKLEPGLNENAFYDPANFTFPAGTYVCEVEVDPDTGTTQIVSFVAVDDFGKIVNPMIVEGQVHGGLVQGLGQAMVEAAVYDANGQLQSGSFMDYGMPRADMVPSFKVSTKETACTHNLLGVKGCGEAGAIGSPAAYMNAVRDALAPAGAGHVEMPATPHRIWQALRSKGVKQAAE